MRTSRCSVPLLAAMALALSCTNPAQPEGGRLLVDGGSPTRYLANATDPGIGTSWVEQEFDDGAWIAGQFGVGRESGKKGGARLLIARPVPPDARSVYTRTTFVVDDASSVQNLFFGVDYDDGYVAWINGVEVARSGSMPEGTPAWDHSPTSHESSNGGSPDFGSLQNISATGIPLLTDGANILAIGVWDHGGLSSDLVLVPRLVADQPDETFVTRGPYLQLGTPSSVIVRWRTDKPSDSRVAYGRSPDALDRFVVDDEVTTEHSVQIDGLEADSKFYYSVGSSRHLLVGMDAKRYFRTSPPHGARVPVRAWILGDSGTGSFHAGTVRNGYETYSGNRHTSLWLMLGDNAYPEGSEKNYQRAMFNMYRKMLARTVVWSTMGNHDVVVSFEPPVGPYYEIFDLPTRGEAGGVASGTEDYYSIDFANVHFVCLSSEIALDSLDEMLDWLRRDLDATEMDWIVAFWHHAPYASGRHHSDEDPRSIAMREEVLPILDAEGVDLTLTGHAHAYGRTALLRGHYGMASTLTPEAVLDGGDGRVDGSGAYRKIKGRPGGQGIVHVVVGCSGEALDDQLGHPAMFITFKKIGSLVLDIDGDRLDARMVDRDGNVRDSFTIIKEDPPAAAAPSE